MLKNWVHDERNVAHVFGLFGVVALLTGVPLLIVSHIFSIERFEYPGLSAFAAMTCMSRVMCSMHHLNLGNALFGSVLSDFLLSVAVVLLSPLVASVSQYRRHASMCTC